MEHREAQNELQAYLDGALPPEGERALRAHLDGCAACRAELALLREVDRALRAWPVQPEPEGLAARVMAEVRASPPPPSRAALGDRLRALGPWLRTLGPWLRTLGPWLRAHWSEVLLGAATVATLVILAVSLRAASARGALDLRFWGLQAQRALASVERAWYDLRAGSMGSIGARPARRGQARSLTQFYCWAAGAIAILAAGASAWVLARQWRRGPPRFSRT
jgi:anti-sigma factor RsiW